MSYQSDDVQAALVDVQRYLLDQIPPLTAVDSVQTVMTQPPQMMMRLIHAWAVEQSRFQEAAMCDFLFHAIKKLHLFANLKLLDRVAVETYLNGLMPLAMESCPADERELLNSNLRSLKDSLEVLGGGAVDIGKPSLAKSSLPRGAISDVVTKSARRLGMVVDRLKKYVKPGSGVASWAQTPEMAPEERPGAQLLTMAAAGSTSEEQLRDYIESIRPFTGDNDPANLLRILASSVPSWDLMLPPDAKVKPPASIEAMHKIVALTRDPMESMKRFRELMMSAVEQFNNGALSAALSMLELAQTLVAEKKLDPLTVDRIRGDAVDALSSEQFKKYSENKTKRALLPKALAFFPTLTRETLFQELRGEQRPERRRSLLGLLEAYGVAAREGALNELEAELNRTGGEQDTYYLRNVIYLLHRIPRESEEGVERELELLTRASARGQNIYVIKEAVIPVGQMKGGAAVKLLVMRLAEFEAILVRNDTSLYPIEEMQKLLDRIIAALARTATPAALLTIARHGLKPNPILGDTRGRLAALSQHDLSFDEETVNLIIKTIRDDLPKKLLGKIMIPKIQPPPVRLIEALSSTRSEAVESLFSEIAEKFPDHDVGKMAAAALQNLASAGKQAAAARDGAQASLTGDLQFFGLPALMQSLADNQATGIVTLSSKATGQTSGKVLFVEGKFADAQCGPLRGTDAIYQMLERPIVGTFAFVPQPPVSVKTRTAPTPVVPLLMEGIRRYDELKQACALVPDDLSLRPTENRPSPDPEETDPALIREVWLKASTGGRVGEWESEIAADAFRIRRLVARWLEEGSLQPA